MGIETDMLTRSLMKVEIEIARKYLLTHSLFRDSFVERPYLLMNLRSTDWISITLWPCFGLVRVAGVFMGNYGFTLVHKSLR